MAQNSCHTYFKIVGDFNPDEITQMLGLQPNKSWKIGDTRRNGLLYDFALWEFGRCDDYDVIIEKQMHKTIDPLLDKIDLLTKIREKYDVSFCLEIVPTIYADTQSPCLAPSMKVIDFCHATRTEIDIDMYLMSTDEE